MVHFMRVVNMISQTEPFSVPEKHQENTAIRLHLES